MRVLFVGEGGDLASALGREGISVEGPPSSSARERGSEPSEIADGMRHFERLLTAQLPDAAVLASTSNEALAAILVATKVGMRVARLVPDEADRGGSAINERVIEQLADAAVESDPQAIAAWVGNIT